MKQCNKLLLPGLALLLAACATNPASAPDDTGDPPPGAAEDPGAPPSAADPAPEPRPREPVDPDVLFHVLAAERLGQTMQSQDSLEHYLEAAAGSEDPEVAEQATRMALGIPDWEAAVTGAERWRELAPENPVPLQVLASAHLHLGREEAAADALEAVLDSVSGTESGWRQVAALLGSAPDPGAARRIMQTLVERREAADADTLWGQSLLAWRLDDLDRALDLAERAANLSGTRKHLVWVAQLHVSAGDLEQSLAWYRRAREQAPEDLELALGTAEILHRLDRTGEALDLLEPLPAGTESLYSRGMYTAEIGRVDDAREIWHALAGLETPEEAGVHAFYTAQLAELVDWPERAVEWYGRVAGGELAERATLRRAVLLGEAGEIERARSLLAGIRSGGDARTAEQSWFQEAQVLQAAGMGREALDVLSRALAEQPDSVTLLYARALQAVALDDIDLAEQDLRRILQGNPDNAQAMNALGYTLADRTTRYQEARRLIDRALELTPEDPAVLDSKGWVLFKQGRPDEAEGWLRKAFERDPMPEIRAHLVEVLHALGRHDEAQALLAEGFEASPDDSFLIDVRDRLYPQLDG